MSTSRRVLRFAAAAFLFGGLLRAQPATLPEDSIPNWISPPFWIAKSEAPKPNLSGEGGPIGTQAADGVPTPPLPLVGINPCRIVDTRGNGFTGAYGPPSLVAGQPRSFTLAGQCGIGAGAEAVSLNVTVTNTLGPGFILLYPQGGGQPTVSTLNYVAGQTVANAAIVPLGGGGGVTIVAGVSGTDLILDTNGYYAPQSVVNTVNGLSGNVTLAQGSNISIAPSGNTLTIANTAPAAWSLTGNSISPGQFLGTTNTEPLELRVNGARALRLERGLPTNNFGPNLIGGYSGNSVTAGVAGATIAGGGQAGSVNIVTDNQGTIGGGFANQAGDGDANLDDSSNAVVAGGLANEATGNRSAILGGSANTASGSASAVLGGQANLAGGSWATVAGGADNIAAGSRSFAAGWAAQANHLGAFVWADSSAPGVPLVSTVNNQFVARAAGGFRFFVGGGVRCDLTGVSGWSCQSPSDRALKERVEPVVRRDALSRLMTIPIQTWSYIDQKPAVRHMGPMAQDFAAAFGLGSDDKFINPLDANGVALAAIQGLYEMVREKDAEIAELKARLSRVEAAIE